MDPNNQVNNPQDIKTPPQDSNPGTTQPLNPVQVPTEMPMGEPTAPLLPPQSTGLPVDLPSTVEVSKPKGSSGILIVMSIILVILIISGVGGYLFYTNMNKPINNPPTQVVQSNQNNQELTGLSSELENVELADPEGALGEVNQEITLLEATPSSK